MSHLALTYPGLNVPPMRHSLDNFAGRRPRSACGQRLKKGDHAVYFCDSLVTCRRCLRVIAARRRKS